MATSQQAELAGASSRVTDMREMAMFHNSNTFVWIRATDAGTVLVYASVNFRNAFAQPVELTANEADAWAALAEPLTADSLRFMAARRDRPDTTSARDELARGDFVLLSRPGTDPPSLTVKIGALGPGGVTTTFLAPTLGSVAQAIREAARAAREMEANRAADSTARAASLAAASLPVQQVPLAVAQPAPADSSSPSPLIPVVPAADPSAVASLTAPVATAPVANLAQRPLAAAARVRVKAYAASTPLAAPPGARTTAVTVRSAPQPATVAIVATATPVIPSAPAAPGFAKTAAAPAAVPAVAAPPATPAPVVAAPAPAAPVAAAPVAPKTVAAAPTPPPARALSDSGELSDGGLSDDEFTTEVHRRESAMTACYSQYGLSANPALRGRVTVRISLSDSGEVMRATVVNRSWSAAVPTEVESCIVHHVFVWHFPVARRSSIHDYTVVFGH
ncbi:MAG: AgmX/PglI C-terminal domain-containing protein [Gemmatimonadales bacterium]